MNLWIYPQEFNEDRPPLRQREELQDHEVCILSSSYVLFMIYLVAVLWYIQTLGYRIIAPFDNNSTVSIINELNLNQTYLQKVN